MRAKSLFASFLGSAALLAATHVFAIGEDEYMNPEDAFKYTATADEQNVTIEWQATKGYYLYKKRMGLDAATPGVTVGESVYPKGEIHKDEYFGEQEIFRGTFKVTAPLTGAKVGDSVALKLKWQGCADAGLCYPPSVWDATVKVVAATHTTSADKLFERANPTVEGEEEYLDVDQAFALTNQALSVNNLQLNWRIADGYYLYKQRIKVEPAGDTKVIGALVLPKGEAHSDEYLRRAGNLSPERRRHLFRAAVRCKDCRCERDLPGLRRCRPLLSAADHARFDLARGCAGDMLRRPARRTRRPTNPSRTATRKRSSTGIFSSYCCRSSARVCCWLSRPVSCRWFRSFPASSLAAART